MNETNEKLSMLEKVGYGMGDMAANFVFQALLALQLSFYTDTFGLTPAQAGTMFMVIGLSMAMLNPVMGIVADRTSTRWGRFRPWLLWTALPFGLIGVLTFSTPQIALGAKIVYAWATYFLLRLIYTMNNVPYASLTGVLTGDPDERTSITSIRLIFANSAGFLVQSLAIPLVAFLGKGNNARGYQLTMGLFSMLSVVLFLVAFAVTKERIAPPPGQKTSVLQDVADLLHNGPWVILFCVTTFYFAAIVLRGNLMLPYFKYCSGNQMLFSWFNGFGLTALLAGVACSTTLTRRLGKRTLFFWSMLLCGLFCCALYFVPPTAIVPIFTMEVLRQFAYGCSGPVLWAMMADVADFGEWKTGRRATATVTAAVVFALWVGIALGGALAGWLLSIYSYLPGATAQSATALRGIRAIASLYAGFAFFGAAICLIFYGINMKMNMTISHDLGERRKKHSTPSPEQL